MPRDQLATLRAGFGVLGCLTIMQPAVLSAQEPGRLFPGREYLPKLLAAPREPTSVAKFVWATDSPSRFGPGIEGEVALGATLPVLLLTGSSVENAVAVGFEAAVFGRFSLKTEKLDFIDSDWVFTVPIVLRRGRHWLRLRYRHVSAHLGDEYAERFDLSRVEYGRDAAEVIGFVHLTGGVGVYGGPDFSFNVDPDGARRWGTRAGVQVEFPSMLGPLRPFAATDVKLDHDNNWDPRVNVQAGLAYLTRGGTRLRGVAEFLTGPSPRGQFFRQRATTVTLGLYVDP